MLIVDVNTLLTVNLLNFCNDIVLNSLYAVYSQNISRIDRALSQRISCLDCLTLTHLDLVAVRYSIALLLGVLCVLACDSYLLGLLDLFYADNAADLCDDSSTLRSSALEKLLNTGKTLCNILARCNSSCMEGSHRKLCTGLTDGLSRNNSDCLTDLNKVAVCKVSTVALSTYTVRCITLQYRTDSN